jgi:hypothetical protein
MRAYLDIRDLSVPFTVPPKRQGHSELRIIIAARKIGSKRVSEGDVVGVSHKLQNFFSFTVAGITPAGVMVAQLDFIGRGMPLLGFRSSLCQAKTYEKNEKQKKNPVFYDFHFSPR